jgi:hypothetical protein
MASYPLCKRPQRNSLLLEDKQVGNLVVELKAFTRKDFNAVTEPDLF